MKKLLSLVLFFFIISSFAQLQNNQILTLEEYVGYVKKHHPIVKQAKLTVAQSEAKLLKARGVFDPKIDATYSIKKFKQTEYYKKLNTTFKIPTWYGVELKANYQKNEGKYLNTELSTPDEGLYSVGVSIPLAKDFLMNKRMASLKKAKLYNEIGKYKQQLLVSKIIFDAINTYFLWFKNYKELNIYKSYSQNAKQRLENTIKSFKAGDKAKIDTLEASINYKNRLLDLEKAKIKYLKSSFEVSNYLWINNNTPIELKTQIHPDENTSVFADKILHTSILNVDADLIKNHPKVKALYLKQQQLKIDKKLKINNLLPKINAEYNFLTSKYKNFNSFNTSNYKAGVNVSIPLFLRKQRADLKLARLKVKHNKLAIEATKLNLQNKIKVTQQQIISYQKQQSITEQLVEDYKQLVSGEEKKFFLGEGSLFLINYREAKLIETELKNTKILYQVLLYKSKLANLLVDNL